MQRSGSSFLARSGSFVKRSGSAMLKRDASARSPTPTLPAVVYSLSVTVHYVDRLSVRGNIVVALEKTDQRHPVCSPEVAVNPSTRTAMFMDAVLQTHLTFSPNRADGTPTHAVKPKLVKLAIRAAHNKDGASISKTYFNAADYIDVKPPGRKVRVDLENGGSVIATLMCVAVERADTPPTNSDSPTCVGELAASGSGFLARRLNKAIGLRRPDGTGMPPAAQIEQLQLQKEKGRLRTLLEAAQKKAHRAQHLRKDISRLADQVKSLEQSRGDDKHYHQMVRTLCDVREQKARLQLEKERLEFALGISRNGDGGTTSALKKHSTTTRRP